MKHVVVLLEPVYSSISGYVSDTDAHVLGVFENRSEAERYREAQIKENAYEPCNIHVLQVLA